ncbi:hypothetical protein CHS0354_023362 [Potamilus streckersoni]|uniref:Transmembrane protein n=1 Tax=Potamilus streckersoni TaxID=2493646 RepID=A0AAE0W7B1_9BIVA|nr:hypothetical protein CHS0354_023362 [Potamilus streckersoni]
MASVYANSTETEPTAIVSVTIPILAEMEVIMDSKVMLAVAMAVVVVVVAVIVVNVEIAVEKNGI